MLILSQADIQFQWNRSIVWKRNNEREKAFDCSICSGWLGRRRACSHADRVETVHTRKTTPHPWTQKGRKKEKKKQMGKKTSNSHRFETKAVRKKKILTHTTLLTPCSHNYCVDYTTLSLFHVIKLTKSWCPSRVFPRWENAFHVVRYAKAREMCWHHCNELTGSVVIIRWAATIHSWSYYVLL